MGNLLLLFVYLAFFRASPAQVPAGRTTLVVAVVTMVLANTAVTYTWYGLGVGLLLASLDVLLSGAYLYGCLAMRQRTVRFEQSFAALCGISAVMALVAWPWALEVGANLDSLPAWVKWGQLVLMMWSMLIWASLLRVAGGFDRVTAAALSLSYFFFSAVVFAFAASAVA